MAEAIEGARRAAPATASTRPERAMYQSRLLLGAVALLGALVFVFGTSWDIQWHTFVGRDRTLIPPHDLMLGGIALCGLVALASVLLETVRAARDPRAAAATTEFAGLFRAPLGAYLAGFGALSAGLGFPLDAYWHALYGIDVSIWAPFHVMILAGMAIATLGVAFMLRSGASLAARANAAGAARAGEFGVIVALACLTSMLLLFLDAALSNLYLSVLGLRISVFPLMVGVFGIFPLAAVVRAVPWAGAASIAAGVYYLLDLLVFLAVPPLTNALVVAEHQTFRSGQPNLVVVSAVWPLSLIVATALLDIAAAYTRRRGLAGQRANRPLLLAAGSGVVLVPLLDPFFIARYLSRAVSATSRLHGPLVVIVLLVLALLLGVAAAVLGSRVGLDVGDALASTER